jgi:hypothetical protein
MARVMLIEEAKTSPARRARAHAAAFFIENAVFWLVQPCFPVNGFVSEFCFSKIPSRKIERTRA